MSIPNEQGQYLSTQGQMVRLRLYVAGESPNSVQAIANLQDLIEEYHLQQDLEIVDILSEPLRALEDGVLVTPTLVKLSPSPVTRIIGNLSEKAKVAGSLGLTVSLARDSR